MHRDDSSDFLFAITACPFQTAETKQGRRALLFFKETTDIQYKKTQLCQHNAAMFSFLTTT